MAEESSVKAREALRAAQLYFQQDLTMEAIAAEMGVSRSSVSRLLSFARAAGLVEIRVHSPHERAGAIQREIARRHDVAAHVVPVPDHTSEVDRLERVSLSAARMLGRFIDSNMTVGIAWGSTMTAVSRHLEPRPLHDVVFVQLNGAANNETTGIVYASEILRRFADAYAATTQQFPVPAFFDDPATKAAMWRERSTQRVLGIHQRMDAALFGLGSPFSTVPGHVYAGGYLDKSDMDSLRDQGVVGDVATVFYRADGSWRDIPINARASGPDPETLRHVARRIAIVAGASRMASLRGALAAGLITDLVLDEGAARALLAG